MDIDSVRKQLEIDDVQYRHGPPSPTMTQLLLSLVRRLFRR